MRRKKTTTVAICIADPTFNNLARLRVGGLDRFSRMSLAALRRRPEFIIDDADLSDRETAAAYRWVRRGLPAKIALQKITVDRHIAKLATLGKQPNQQSDSHRNVEPPDDVKPNIGSGYFYCPL